MQKNSLVLLFFIPAIFVYAGNPVSRDAGFELLQNFQCDSKSDVAQRVIDSIKRTKDVAKSIGETEDACKQISDQIAQIPGIDEISDSIYTNSIVNEIRLQEALINEALADMSFITNLPEGDPQHELYPDSAALAFTVQRARSELIELKARLKVQEAGESRVNSVNGIRQLDSIAQSWAALIRDNNKCFDKSPSLKQHLISGLIGIAGFFLKGPLGIATTLAGKLLQDVFMIRSASKNRIGDSFKVVDQTAITLGLGCAYEHLGKQHCRILREKQLFTALNNKNDRSNCTGNCGQDVIEVLEKQRNLFEALKKVEDWTSKTSGAILDENSALLNEKMKSSYRDSLFDTRSSVLKAQTTAKSNNQKFNGSAQMEGLIRGLNSFSDMLQGKSNNGMSSGPELIQIKNSFTEEERQYDFLKLILKPEEDPKVIFSALKQEDDAYYVKRYGNNNNGMVVMNNSGRKTAFDIFYELHVLNSEDQGETVKMLIARLQDKSTPQLILNQLNEVEKTLDSKTTTDLSNDQVLANMLDYFNGNDVFDASTSPNQSLKYLDLELQMMKKNLGDNIDRSGINKLADSVHQMVNEIKEDQVSVSNIDQQRQFIINLNILVGSNKELYNQLKTVLNSQLAEEGKELLKASRETKDQNNALKALFLLNSETLSNTMGFSKNPSAKMAEYDTAIALSAAQLDGFSKFSEPYTKLVTNYFNGKDARGKPLPTAILQNSSPELKNRFCIQSLSLTEIPVEINEICKGASIQSDNLKVTFDAFNKLDHQKRSCAYYNFSTQEQAASQNRFGK